MESVVLLDGVAKSFHRIPVLRDATLEVRRGERLGVVGPNGSGKSVLFKLMCRFLQPDSGLVTINPRYLSPRGVFPVGFGIIIDRPGYVATRTGLQNLLDLARIRKVVGRDEVIAAMEQVGLDPAAPQRVGHYSVGMKQKLALAQSFMEGQEVLLLDEPFNGLDEASVEHTRALLRTLSAAGRTIVFTSHVADDIRALATRTVKLTDGRIVPG